MATPTKHQPSVLLTPASPSPSWAWSDSSPASYRRISRALSRLVAGPHVAHSPVQHSSVATLG